MFLSSRRKIERPEQALVSNCDTKSKLLLTSQKEKEGGRVQTITTTYLEVLQKTWFMLFQATLRTFQ